MKETKISWQTSARKGWANKQSLRVGPFIVWVTRQAEDTYDVTVRTVTDVLLDLKGLNLTEVQARDLATNRTHDLLKGYLTSLSQVSMLTEVETAPEVTESQENNL